MVNSSSWRARPTVAHLNPDCLWARQRPAPVRASNCLESAKIHTIGDLVKMTEGDLLKVHSFGKTSLREVKRKLQDIGLSLGMALGGPAPTETPTAQ